MTAMLNDLLGGDSLADLQTPSICPAQGFTAPVLNVTVNDQAVLAIARQLHDGACLHGTGCGLRDFHAMDVYEPDVRVMLAAMVRAPNEIDNPEISPCRRATERRWIHGKWWCAACGGGMGWVHTPCRGVRGGHALANSSLMTRSLAVTGADVRPNPDLQLCRRRLRPERQIVTLTLGQRQNAVSVQTHRVSAPPGRELPTPARCLPRP